LCFLWLILPCPYFCKQLLSISLFVCPYAVNNFFTFDLLMCFVILLS
jgi:hypothetical protein